MLARVARQLPVAVVEAVDVLLEARLSQPLGEALGIPDHREFHPVARGGGLLPLRQEVRVTGFEWQGRQLFIHQEAALIAHQREGDFEGGGGRQLAGAVTLGAEGFAAAIGEQQAARGGAGGQGTEEAGGKQAGQQNAGHEHLLDSSERG
ncbi:hypothetical protein D3C79_920900 [compost metagenome]